MTIPNQGLKKCTKCGAIKYRTDFYLQSACKNGKKYPGGECKSCTMDRRKQYKIDNPEHVFKLDKAYRQKRNIRVKEAVFAAYGGYKCACCGETEKLFLTIDHITNDGANHRRKISGKRTTAGLPFYMWLVRNNFPEGLQILCMNCQHGKRMNNGICPHKARCNDHPVKGVESSDSKRIAPYLKLVDKDEDMVSSAYERCSSL